MSALEDLLDTQLRFAGITGYLREYAFAKQEGRRWRLDFAFPDLKLAVEVHGAVWTGGRHVTGKGFTADCEKRSEAAIRGWRLLEVTADMVNSGAALALIERALGGESHA